MAYYLGLDAGGTKTHVLIGDERGNILGFGKAGTGNYEGYGIDPARVEIQKAVDAALASAGITLAQVSGIGMGVAGADVPEDYVMLEREIFGPMFGEIPTVFRNDSMAGLRGGLREPYGVVIACGTGCVCAGRNRAGKETRAGGISEAFGDAVSGTDIGIEGLKIVWRYRDGIVPHSLLVDKFLARSGQTYLDAFFYAMYREELCYEDLQPMAKLVFDAAYEGDPQACDLLERSGAYLGDMVLAVARALHMEREAFDVVMAGSVFKGSSPVLRDAMTTRIHRVAPLARPVMALYEPVVGALLLAMESAATMDDSFHVTLGESLASAESRYGVRFRAE
jgi:N-acetylglucosamine kinase-like BadF-type ATPase